MGQSFVIIGMNEGPADVSSRRVVFIDRRSGFIRPRMPCAAKNNDTLGKDILHFLVWLEHMIDRVLVLLEFVHRHEIAELDVHLLRWLASMLVGFGEKLVCPRIGGFEHGKGE